ncbi:UDP-N-acetylglucosamine transferase subunit ALG13 homolog [Microplitis demolitor]|uniref:UDP-N-acetylglucosamine transferase subunit ALG13 homolog n=1 Tax=Microplitis demolitor TaxID=69319 RepID=UPI0004CCD46C|nr:UDP-N-acetylglucosamine transferase subunit ALG13 homolog [Microplitis demolitor]
MKAAMTIFVTVGTTKFDKLIETVMKDDILMELNKRGYSYLILQIGNTNLMPDCTPRCGFNNIEMFNLKPSINEYMKSADLIISHAGAGSCLEALEANKPLIVVTNDLLMDNHQSELAEQLHKDKHLFQCTCDTLLQVCKTMHLSQLEKFVDDKSPKIAKIIDDIMGFS